MARLAFAALSAACVGLAAAGIVRPFDTACVMSADNKCPVDKLEINEVDSSALVYPGGNTRCAFDAFTDGANFTTNATFFFQVFPAPATASKKKLLLYLQGGGACTDATTCNFALQCNTQTFQPNARALSVGVLNRTQPENLFNDWTIVHVPYCTGDVHIGNAVREYEGDGVAAILDKDICLNQNQSVHNNGYNNSMAAFKWALENYPEVDQLAIAGSSAGSLGAQLFGQAIADMWDVEEKKIKYAVIADSYVGVVPDENPPSIYVNYLGACDLPIDLPEDVVTKCKNESATIEDFMVPLLQRTKSYADWMFINSMGDDTQRLFYELFRVGVFGFPFNDNNTISEEDFYSNMTEILDEYDDHTSRITTFFVEGDEHVFFTQDDYYATLRMKTNETLGAVLKTVLTSSSMDSSSTAGSDVPAPPTSDASSTTFKALCSLATVAVTAVLAL